MRLWERVRNLAVQGHLKLGKNSRITVVRDDGSEAQVNLLGGIANVTASTLAVSREIHDGRTITLNRAAGIAVTLPAAAGTGAKYRFFVGTTVTSNSTTIKVANGSDVMSGLAMVAADGGNSINGFETAATDDTITFNGTTTGGVKGDVVELEDVAVNLWNVRVIGSATGTEATPFSATVS